MGMLEENHLDFSTPLVNGLIVYSPRFSCFYGYTIYWGAGSVMKPVPSATNHNLHR